MNSKETFLTRLRVRLGMPFNTDMPVLFARIGGRQVEIRPESKAETLSRAKWVIFSASGFDSELAAREFGEQLQTITGIVGVCSRLGIDVGDNKSTSHWNQEWLRLHGIIKEDERMPPNVHGLLVLPDDNRSRFLELKADVTVIADPTVILEAAESLGTTLPIAMTRAAMGVRILNLALTSREPLTKIVLTISVIEALGQDKRWTENQTAMIRQLAENLGREFGQNPEAREVVDALNRLHPISLRQGVRRVLAELNLKGLQKEWDRLYDKRSGVFHGRENLTESELQQLAQDSITLCGKIIIALLKQEGIEIPAIAAKNY